MGIARLWNLGLNISKCAVMRFGIHQAKEDIFNYNIDSKLLHFVSSNKDLGVLIDS